MTTWLAALAMWLTPASRLARSSWAAFLYNRAVIRNLFNRDDAGRNRLGRDEIPVAGKEPLYVLAGCSIFLLIGLLLDVATAQELVIAIVYNIPIAFAGLANSRRLTVVMVLLALAANVLAGFFNAQAGGGIDATALLNRGIAALSFLLVGYLTWALRDASSRLTAAQLDHERAAREHALHEILAELSGPLRPQALLERTCAVLRKHFGAEAVVVASLEQHRFTAPRSSDPPGAPFAQLGETAPWVVAAIPTAEPPVITARADTDLLSVGRWRRTGLPDLVVLIVQPAWPNPSLLLGDALRDLEALLERSVLLENLDAQRGELAHRNTVIRDLVYAFSHDLRTPLMANAMNMRLALEGVYGPLNSEFQRSLENGLRSNEDLLELADALLLVARYESGEPLSYMEPVNLSALVHEVSARLSPVFEEKSQHVALSAPDKLLVLGRPGELRRVFQNLLDNAAKFSPLGAVISVALRAEADSASEQGVRFEVLDCGPGISESQESRLFQRFSSGKAGGGTGLGLYLAQQIVTAHGGHIGYRPREGGGSCFSLWLPIAKEAITT